MPGVGVDYSDGEQLHTAHGRHNKNRAQSTDLPLAGQSYHDHSEHLVTIGLLVGKAGKFVGEIRHLGRRGLS